MISDKKNIFWGGIVFLLVVVLVGGFIALSSRTVRLPTFILDFVQFGNGIEERISGGPKGKIYITLLGKGDATVNLYVLDVATARFSPLFDVYGQKDFGDSHEGYTSKFSADGDKVAYIAASNARAADGTLAHKGTMDVFAFDTVTRKSSLLAGGTSYPRLPQWSPDSTKIAFTALDSGSLIWQPNDWGVYVADLNGNRERLTYGTYPYWSPDGDKMLFMRADGLYLYDLGKKSEERVHVFSRNASVSLKIGLSPDGSLLAMSVPSTYSVYLFEIFSWEPFRMDALKVAKSDNTLSFWPVFSPDNRFLVLQQAEWDDATKTRSNTRLVAYNLEDFTSETIASLENFNFDFAFTSDWRYDRSQINAKSEKNQVSKEVFKNILVDGSPWSATWDVHGKGFTRSGANKMEFSFGDDETSFLGRLTDVGTGGIASGAVEDILLREDGCVRFVSSVTKTAYMYCLADDGTLKGYVNNKSQQEGFVGETAARPATR